AVESEHGPRGHDTVGRPAGGDEVDARDEYARRVLGPEQDDAPYHRVQHGRAERAGEATTRPLVVAQHVQVDAPSHVDLDTGQEEDVELPTLSKVEELLGAYERHPALEAGEPETKPRSMAPLGEQHTRCRDRRVDPDAHPLAIMYGPSNRAGHDLLNRVQGPVRPQTPPAAPARQLPGCKWPAPAPSRPSRRR